jgi:acyl-CoA reductase-like NAD-dependent aldehyde dehydrogenase
MRVFTEETFGPVTPVFKFSSEAEAVALANDTEFGLAAYFYTRDLGRAFRCAEALQYGMVGVNEVAITSEVAPFGGEGRAVWCAAAAWGARGLSPPPTRALCLQASSTAGWGGSTRGTGWRSTWT